MGFIAKAFKGPDLSAQKALQQQQLDDVRKANQAQADLIAEREARTQAAERAQRAVRGGRRRGLLAYTDDMSSATLGGGSA